MGKEEVPFEDLKSETSKEYIVSATDNLGIVCSVRDGFRGLRRSLIRWLIVWRRD
jgi:hypothetical protein